MMERSPNFLHWKPGDHTRLAGKMQFHYRLNFDADGRPMLQVFNTCKHFIRTLPNLVYDESNVEDIDTRQEDHIYDECRYVLMENPISRRPGARPYRRRMTRWTCTGRQDLQDLKEKNDGRLSERSDAGGCGGGGCGHTDPAALQGRQGGTGQAPGGQRTVVPHGTLEELPEPHDARQGAAQQ